MGRLLDALKRLDAEIPLIDSAVPIVQQSTTSSSSPPSPACSSSTVVKAPLAIQDESSNTSSQQRIEGFSFSSAPNLDEWLSEQEENVSFEDDDLDVEEENVSFEDDDLDIEENDVENYLEEDSTSEEQGRLGSSSFTVIPQTSTFFEEFFSKVDGIGQLIEKELPRRTDVSLSTESSNIDILPQPQAFDPPVQTPTTPSSGKSRPTNDPGVFGAIAQSILSQIPTDEPAALFFTSPIDGEGKTESILPLAEALIEQSGRRTILVDANLHRPDLTREWQFSSRRGFYDVLTGNADWWEAVQETGLPKLSILLNNGLHSAAPSLSQPLAFSNLLDTLKREYRLVLIDAASLAHAESVSMARYCQGVYLVVRLGHSSRRAIKEARRILADADANLLGCIAVGDVLS